MALICCHSVTLMKQVGEGDEHPSSSQWTSDWMSLLRFTPRTHLPSLSIYPLPASLFFCKSSQLLCCWYCLFPKDLRWTVCVYLCTITLQQLIHKVCEQRNICTLIKEKAPLKVERLNLNQWIKEIFVETFFRNRFWSFVSFIEVI